MIHALLLGSILGTGDAPAGMAAGMLSLLVCIHAFLDIFVRRSLTPPCQVSFCAVCSSAA
jgi:hypothetical protein